MRVCVCVCVYACVRACVHGGSQSQNDDVANV